MLTLNDGRPELWQWDTGRTLAVDADCSQVHFSNKVFGRSIDVDVNDGVAIIPDILLQTDKELNVWAFVGTAENGYTKISKTFTVNRRNKPADYVFTPTDQTTLDDILGRIEDLEKRPSGGNGGITKEVDPTVPDWAKQPQKPTYTAADVGSIPVPKTATVGQTIVVKAVDETGKPIEWEAADMPSGGGSSLPATGVEDAGKVLTVTEAGVPGWMADGYELILDETLEEEASIHEFYLPKKCRNILMFVKLGVGGTQGDIRFKVFDDFFATIRDPYFYLHIISLSDYVKRIDAFSQTEINLYYGGPSTTRFLKLTVPRKAKATDYIKSYYPFGTGAEVKIWGR